MNLEFLQNVQKELAISSKQVKNNPIVLRNSQVRAFLMHNSKIAFYIENPAFALFKKSEIDEKEFEAANQYSNLYAISIKDNMSKPSYEANFGYGGGKASKREPSDIQIDAAKKIYKIKHHADAELAGILEMFLEKEWGIVKIARFKQVRVAKAKEMIKEALGCVVSSLKI